MFKATVAILMLSGVAAKHETCIAAYSYLYEPILSCHKYDRNRNGSGVVITTSHDANHELLFRRTFRNKIAYSAKHGYPMVSNVLNGSVVKEIGGLFKCHLLKEALRMYPKCSWVYVVDTDHVITNFSVRLESFLINASAEDFHVVASCDGNAPNAGSFFVRNSLKGRAFIDSMCALIPVYMHTTAYENMYICDIYNSAPWMRSILKALPQRSFNSYDPDHWIFLTKPTDILGTDGKWQAGDFMIHFAGQPYQQRLQLAEKYLHLL